jgi:hypothetical protein
MLYCRSDSTDIHARVGDIRHFVSSFTNIRQRSYNAPCLVFTRYGNGAFAAELSLQHEREQENEEKTGRRSTACLLDDDYMIHVSLRVFKA